MAPRPSIVGHDLKVYALLFQADLLHLENPYIWLDGRAGGFGRLLGQVLRKTEATLSGLLFVRNSR